MKTFTNLLLLIAASLLLSCGGTTSNYVTPANARIAAFVACSGTIAAIPEADQQHVCDYVWSIAYGIHTFASGHVPTPEEMTHMIAQFAPSGQKLAFLGVSIGQIWQSVYPSIQGDQKLALDYLNSIASGCQDAAANCRTPTPTPTTPIASSIMTITTDQANILRFDSPRVYAKLRADGKFELIGDHGSFIINTNTGRASFTGDCKPDEAARIFFKAVESLRKQQALANGEIL